MQLKTKYCFMKIIFWRVQLPLLELTKDDDDEDDDEDEYNGDDEEEDEEDLAQNDSVQSKKIKYIPYSFYDTKNLFLSLYSSIIIVYP